MTQNYQWEASDHRSKIITFVGDIMKQQRWYIIDRLHKRSKGAVNCPGCLLHKNRQGSEVNGNAAAGSDGHTEDSALSEGQS
jgi:hypothetical protein